MPTLMLSSVLLQKIQPYYAVPTRFLTLDHFPHTGFVHSAPYISLGPDHLALGTEKQISALSARWPSTKVETRRSSLLMRRRPTIAPEVIHSIALNGVKGAFLSFPAKVYLPPNSDSESTANSSSSSLNWVARYTLAGKLKMPL